MPEVDPAEVKPIGTRKRRTGAARDAVDGTVGVEVAGGVGEADAAEVNLMSTPKRSTGVGDDAAGAVGVEVTGGVDETEGTDDGICDVADAGA